jgi:hypothetical protein
VAFLARKPAGYWARDVAKYFCEEPSTTSQGIKKMKDLLPLIPSLVAMSFGFYEILHFV